MGDREQLTSLSAATASKDVVKGLDTSKKAPLKTSSMPGNSTTSTTKSDPSSKAKISSLPLILDSTASKTEKKKPAVIDLENWTIKLIKLTNGKLNIKIVGRRRFQSVSRACESSVVHHTVSSDTVASVTHTHYRVNKFRPRKWPEYPVHADLVAILQNGFPDDWKAFVEYAARLIKEEDSITSESASETQDTKKRKKASTTKSPAPGAQTAGDLNNDGMEPPNSKRPKRVTSVFTSKASEDSTTKSSKRTSTLKETSPTSRTPREPVAQTMRAEAMAVDDIASQSAASKPPRPVPILTTSTKPANTYNHAPKFSAVDPKANTSMEWTKEQKHQFDLAIATKDPSDPRYFYNLAAAVNGKTVHDILQRLAEAKTSGKSAVELGCKSSSSSKAPLSPLAIDADMSKKKNRKKLEQAEEDAVKFLSGDLYDQYQHLIPHSVFDAPNRVPYIDEEENEESDSDDFLGSVKHSRAQVDRYRQRSRNSQPWTIIAKPRTKSTTLPTKISDATKLIEKAEKRRTRIKERRDEADEMEVEGAITAFSDDEDSDELL